MKKTMPSHNVTRVERTHFSPAYLALPELNSGAYLLKSGQGYVLEPGEDILIKSGNTLIQIGYSSVYSGTDVAITTGDEECFSRFIGDESGEE